MDAMTVGDNRQHRLIGINNSATNAALALWQRVDINNLDASWAQVAPAMVTRTNQAQYAAAVGSDRYVGALSKQYGFDQDRSSIQPIAFMGVDGSGRTSEGLLRGSVTTTKEAIGAGLGRAQAFEAGATYLAAMMKTMLADISRSADMVASAGKGYTVYARVVEPGACSRCVMLAGTTQFKPFLRHPACKCTVQAVPSQDGIWADRQPQDVFDSMSAEEQDRAFTQSGAQSIRDGADMNQIVSARRGSEGISWSTRGYTLDANSGRRMVKTTIGIRPDGTPVRVYTTAEGTTVRGRFGKAQRNSATERLSGARYSSTKRVRLMPETIMDISGNDAQLRKAFLRDAGYLEYVPPKGYGSNWIAEASEMRRQDRILVDRATLKYGNFTLGG